MYTASLLVPAGAPSTYLQLLPAGYNHVNDVGFTSIKLSWSRILHFASSPHSFLSNEVNGYGSAVAGQTVKGDVIVEVREESLDKVEKALLEVQEAVQRYSGEVSLHSQSVTGLQLQPPAVPQASDCVGLPLEQATPFSAGCELVETEVPTVQDAFDVAAQTGCSVLDGKEAVEPLKPVCHAKDGVELNATVPVNTSTFAANQTTHFKRRVHRPSGHNHAQEGLASSAALHDECEPRARLLWTTVGKVTSVGFAKPNSSVVSHQQHQESSMAVPYQRDTLPSPSNRRLKLEGSHCNTTNDLSGSLSSDTEPQSEELWGWADLLPDLVHKLVEAGKYALPLAVILSQTCRAWRKAISSDEKLLKALVFKIPTLSLGVLQQSHRNHSSSNTLYLRSQLDMGRMPSPLPVVVQLVRAVDCVFGLLDSVSSC
eukprot:jgi/Botrbrau1/6688/Bobra.0202s0027.2